MAKKSKTTISIRLPDDEHKIISDYAAKSDRTITDIIRAFVRSLKAKS